MLLRQQLQALACAAILVVSLTGSAAAQLRAGNEYDVAYLGQPLADPVAQLNKETYASFGCHYCHGLNLVPRGEAPDLRRAVSVGRDVNGDVLIPLLRKGIPQTAALSPMPQYGDLSDQQLGAITQWIHYARQRDRITMISEAKSAPGDAAAGKSYFEKSCASCHSGGMANIGKKYDATALRAQILEPKALAGAPSFKLDAMANAQRHTARDRHNSLLENYSAADVANLVAYLQGGN
jgi:cytochrome c5